MKEDQSSYDLDCLSIRMKKEFASENKRVTNRFLFIELLFGSLWIEMSDTSTFLVQHPSELKILFMSYDMQICPCVFMYGLEFIFPKSIHYEDVAEISKFAQIQDVRFRPSFRSSVLFLDTVDIAVDSTKFWITWLSRNNEWSILLHMYTYILLRYLNRILIAYDVL